MVHSGNIFLLLPNSNKDNIYNDNNFIVNGKNINTLSSYDTNFCINNNGTKTPLYKFIPQPIKTLINNNNEGFIALKNLFTRW